MVYSPDDYRQQELAWHARKLLGRPGSAAVGDEGVYSIHEDGGLVLYKPDIGEVLPVGALVLGSDCERLDPNSAEGVIKGLKKALEES